MSPRHPKPGSLDPQRRGRVVTVDRIKGVIALLLLSVAAWVGLRGCGPTSAPLSGDDSPPRSHETVTVPIAGRAFELELALTPAQRYQGLSDRESIPEDGGMLFVFPDEDERTFVMRRCLVPIDLIYLDAERRVLNTHQMTLEPYGRPDWLLTGYDSEGPAQYAIELRGGTLDELNLSPGERVEVPTGLKKRAR